MTGSLSMRADQAQSVAYLIEKPFLDATQECFENSIATAILQLGARHPEIDTFTGHAFLDKKKLWFISNRGYCVRFHPTSTCMTSALVRTDPDVPDWLFDELRHISRKSTEITLEYQRTCLRQGLYKVLEVDEDELEIIDDQSLAAERGVVAGLSYHAGVESAEQSASASRVLGDPTWNQGVEQITAPGKGLVTSSGDLSNNPNAQGFAAEKIVINEFNEQAAASESPYRAISAESFGGKESGNAPDIQIINLQTGEIVDQIQIKSGSHQYVSASIEDHRYEGMEVLHNTEAGNVDNGASRYTSPDQSIQVAFSRQQAHEVAGDPYDYAYNERASVQQEVVTEKLAGTAEALSAGAVAGAGISVAAGFAECLGAIARGDSERSLKILESIPERTKDGTLRSLGRAGVIAASQALIGANPVAAGAGIVGVDLIRYIGDVLNGEKDAEEAFREIAPKSLGTMATVSLCMVNPAIAVGIIGYRFAYSFIRSYSKSSMIAALQASNAL